MNKQDALRVVEEQMQKENLKKHCWAVGACMGGIYDFLSEKNPELVAGYMREDWEVVGIIHDADYEQTMDKPEKHTLLAKEWMQEHNADERLINAVLAHNYGHGQHDQPPQTSLDWALVSGDDLSGLIIATALVMPDKKLEQVQVESVLKKYKDKSFAAGVDRERIALCEGKLSVPLEEFVRICLESMQKEAEKLGL